jgi:acetolactate synthase I/II/III large subunit
MTKIKVSDYLAQKFVEAGVKHVFLVTGGGAMHLNDSFARNKNFEIVCFHHEQAAAMAAESYYRVTGRPVVLNVTTGPGGINALNGVYGAYVDSLAMFVVSGQVKNETYSRNYSHSLRQLGDQEVDILAMAKPIVKYATFLGDIIYAKEKIDKAIFLASNGRPGPVWIDIPIDVQSMLIDPSAPNPFDVKNLIFDKDVQPNTKSEILAPYSNIKHSIDTILARLRSSKRPVLFAGSGVRISGMREEFLKLADILKIPVVTGWNAHDILTNDNYHYCGRPGTVGDRAGNFTVQNSDFLLVLGSRLNIRQISYNFKNFAPRAWKAIVDIDFEELKKPTLFPDLAVHADLRDFIPNLIEDLGEYTPTHQEYLNWCKELVTRYPVVLPEYQNKKNLINPYVFVSQLFRDLKHDDIVVTGNGSACVITFQAAKLKNGQRLYTNSGSASMGYDLPAAIGASLSKNKSKVICIAGDGSIMMNLQELQTVVGYNLPIKIIILNNNGYHSIRQTQNSYFSDNLVGIDQSNGVSFPNFVDIGRSFKIDSVKISSIDDWNSEETKKLFYNNDPAIFEIIIDPDQGFSPKLAAKKMPDGSLLAPSLENMSPFLSDDEMKRNYLE